MVKEGLSIPCAMALPQVSQLKRELRPCWCLPCYLGPSPSPRIPSKPGPPHSLQKLTFHPQRTVALWGFRDPGAARTSCMSSGWSLSRSPRKPLHSEDVLWPYLQSDLLLPCHVPQAQPTHPTWFSEVPSHPDCMFAAGAR